MASCICDYMDPPADPTAKCGRVAGRQSMWSTNMPTPYTTGTEGLGYSTRKLALVEIFPQTERKAGLVVMGRTGSQKAYAISLALTQTSCVTVGKSFNDLVPQFPHLWGEK